MPQNDLPLGEWVEGPSAASRRPESPLEALMRAAPGQTPSESVEELQPFREAVADCIDLLDEQDRFIVDALNSEMISLDELGKRLGISKTHAWRLRNEAYNKLRDIMMGNPIIRKRLRLDDGTSETPANNGGI